MILFLRLHHVKAVSFSKMLTGEEQLISDSLTLYDGKCQNFTHVKECLEELTVSGKLLENHCFLQEWSLEIMFHCWGGWGFFLYI